MGMKCSTPCFTVGWVKLGVVTSGKSARSWLYSLSELEIASRCGAGVIVEVRGVEWKVVVSTSLLPLRSTSSPLERRKSAPRSGRLTSAMVKSH